jgi:hypothetical protein
MEKATSGQVHRIVRTALALAAISALISVRAAEQPPSPDARQTLKRDVDARFDVVPLTRGIALSGRTADRRVEIANGVVLSDGAPLSGAELRRRFGPDADLVLRLSYLTDDDLRQLFARVPMTPPGNASPGAPAVETSVPGRPAPPALPSAPVAPAPRTAPPMAQAPPEVGPPAPVFRRSGARLAIAKPVVVAADEEVRDGIFSLGGNVRVLGRVRDDIVVVGATLELAETADVRGDITLVGGELVSAPGARHAGRVHHAVGSDWPRWSLPSVNWSWLGLGGGARWLSLAGTLVRVTLLAPALLIVAFVASGAVGRIGAAVGASPIRAGLTGLAAQVLFIPALVVVAVVMAVSIVGLPFIAVVLPLAVLTMFLAMLLGFAGLAQRVGASLGARMGWATTTGVAVLLGMAFIVLPTVVSRLVGLGPDMLRPLTWSLLAAGTVAEYLAWTVGLGAAILTGLGRFAVVPPPVPPPPSPFDRPLEAPSAL